MSDIPVTFLEHPAIGKPVRIAHNNQEGYTAVVTRIRPDSANPGNCRVWTQAGVVCAGPIAVCVVGQQPVRRPAIPSWAWVVGALVAVFLTLALIGSLLPVADQTTGSEAAPDRTAQVTQELQKYMLDNFGGSSQYPQYAASWFHNIKQYEVSLLDDDGCDVRVATDMWDDSDAAVPALAIANAVLAFDKVHIRRVSVYGVRGGSRVRLLSRNHWRDE